MELPERTVTSSNHINSPRYPKRGIQKKNYTEDSDTDDEHAYCNTCGIQTKGICPTHGVYIVQNKEVPKDGSVPNRASLTIPDILSVGTSSIKGAGMGIWTEENIRKGTVFGPYDGVITFDFEAAHASGYAWEIKRLGKLHHCIDAKDTSRSNWLRFVNCPPALGKENLMAFQYRGEVFYQAITDIPKSCELFVWYGDGYAKNLGVNMQEDKSLSPCKTITGAHRCSACGRLFSSAAFLQMHQRWHPRSDGEKKWKCDHCPYFTNNHSNFQVHQLTHTKKKPFQCPECRKVFSQKINMKTHLLTHTLEKPHECAFCGRGFSQKSNLKRHQLTHSGARPYVCEKCGKKFTQSSNLITHKRLHTRQNSLKCLKLVQIS